MALKYGLRSSNLIKMNQNFMSTNLDNILKLALINVLIESYLRFSNTFLVHFYKERFKITFDIAYEITFLQVSGYRK